MDRGDLDFERLNWFTPSLAFFVVRTNQNVQLQRRCSRPADRKTGVLSDQTVILATAASAKVFPDLLRRIS
jgi:hypothetical protein